MNLKTRPVLKPKLVRPTKLRIGYGDGDDWVLEITETGNLEISHGDRLCIVAAPILEDKLHLYYDPPAK
jgi:hypothetical protein